MQGHLQAEMPMARPERLAYQPPTGCCWAAASKQAVKMRRPSQGRGAGTWRAGRAARCGAAGAPCPAAALQAAAWAWTPEPDAPPNQDWSHLLCLGSPCHVLGTQEVLPMPPTTMHGAVVRCCTWVTDA